MKTMYSRWQWTILALASSALGLTPTRAGSVIDPIIADQVIVRLAAGQGIADFVASYPALGLSTIAGREIPAFGIYLLDIATIPPGETEETVALQLAADPRTRWAEPNYFGDAPEGSARSFYFTEVNVPTWFRDQPAFGEIDLIGAQFGQPGGATATVAVVDTGLAVNHPEIGGTALPGLNLLDNTSNVAEIAAGEDLDGDGLIDEMLGHGTHVATLIAEVSGGAALLPIRAFNSEGNGDNFVLAQAIFEAVERGASVINISAGSTYNSVILEDAVDAARLRGAVVIAAAGNMNRLSPQEYPATDPDAFGVAALDGLQRAAFSNYHPEVDIAAPGVAIYGGLPAGNYAAWSGTSFAAPMVSGVAARIIARHPEWAAAQYRADNIRTILRGTATNVDAQNPGFEGTLGGGLLNAEAAVFEPPAFTTPVALSPSNAPAALAIGDVDRDGDSDLAVLDSSPGLVRILLGDGAGNYSAGPQLSAANNADQLLLVDINGDQAPEVVLNGDNVSLRIYFNTGAGLFQSAAFVPVGADASAIAAGDVDADGAMDLAIATDDGLDAVRVLRNGGAGTFVAEPWMAVGQRPVSIALARLNGDGILDIATANRGADSVSVLHSTGVGMNYSAANDYSSMGGGPRSVVLLDLDADGANDLVVGNNAGRNVVVRWNDGAGGFAAPPLVRGMPESRGVQYLMAGDVTCDGLPDVLIANGEIVDGYVSALISRGSRLPIGVIDWESGVQPEAGAVGDLDGDGVSDVVTANRVDNNVTMLRNLSCTAVGDMNCDRGVSLGDIGGFVSALTEPGIYRQNYPHCRLRNADVNSDGQVNIADIGAFVNLLTQ